MSTSFLHRLLIIAPSAKAITIATWLNANIDPQFCDSDLGPGLNASGLAADPVTHNWMSAALIDSQCKAILAKLCQLASVTPPTNVQWNGWNQAQKIAWLQSVQSAIRASYGVLVGLCDNTAASWDSPESALATMGLKVIAATP